MIAEKRELVNLSALIGQEVFERERAGFFPSGTGRPATPPRLVAGRHQFGCKVSVTPHRMRATWSECTAFRATLNIATPRDALERLPAMRGGRMNEDSDVAFACGMLARHQGTSDMSEVPVEHGENPEMRKLAEKSSRRRWVRSRS